MKLQTWVCAAALMAIAPPALAKQAAPKSPWVGDYVFEEAMNQAVLQYRLHISQNAKTHKLNAALNVDGFQTMSRLWCDVKGDNRRIEVLFNTVRQGHIGPPPRAHTVLFVLERRGRGLHTSWQGLKPGLGNAAQTNGGFTSISD